MISDILLIGANVETISTIRNSNYNTVAIVDPNLKSNTCNNIRVFHHETYIGVNATTLTDMEIGHGIIIGAGSVFTKNIEDKRIVKGNPAK